jgi:GDSL-like Lipase/Acylhydrolase family
MRLLAKVGLVCVLGGALIVPSAASAAPGVQTVRYVALGDSFTSAPFTGAFAGLPLGCARSDNNYPHVVRDTLQPAVFIDVSCGGATTDDFYNPQETSLGTNPPQFDALSADTTVVTVGMSGNDIGYSEILENCISAIPFGSPCRNRYTAAGVDQLAARIAATAPKVAAAIQEIHRRSPAATIYWVGYPAIVPDTGYGCWPTFPIAWGDVPYLRDTERRLNAMLATQAAANGAVYVDTYTPSIGHDVCQPSGVRWVEGLVPTVPAYPVHPNALGNRGMAAAVLAAM